MHKLVQLRTTLCVVRFLEAYIKICTWKINEKGEYKPFFGYTVLAMVDDHHHQFKFIEDFLRSSVISQYYAPLLEQNYHMTVYNLYTYRKDPIPAVKKWLVSENETLPTGSFLPPHVLRSEHLLAVDAIKRHLGESSITIKDVRLEVGTAIKLKVELDSCEDAVLQALRKDLIKIYGYSERNLIFHVTLAYRYKMAPTEGVIFDEFTKDMEVLSEMITKFKGFLEAQAKMCTWKVNEKGEYKPFFGYTVLSMVHDPQHELKSIEDFLRSSIISQYYAPLPEHTYHMTLYDVYTFRRDPIPAVKKWLVAENEILPKDSFLPAHVLRSEHLLAVDAIKKHLGESSITIKDVRLEVSDVIKVKVELDSCEDVVLQELRKDLVKIYGYANADLRFHITLAYLYKAAPTDGAVFDKFTEDMEVLSEMTSKFKGIKLNKYNVYLFDSMVNFMPYDPIN